jgi:hypothetical protein
MLAAPAKAGLAARVAAALGPGAPWLASLVVVVAVAWSAPAAAAGDPLGLNRALAHPSGNDRPGMLWWWPGAAVTDAETTAEIAAMRSAGFGSAQIVDLEGYSDLGGPRSWQWGTPDWFDRFAGALQSAQTRHLRIDAAPYPIWMMTSPAVSGANLDLSAQQLSYGTQQVMGPADLSAAPPSPTGVAATRSSSR